VLYVSGEESKNQLKLRAKRLGVESDNLYVLTETSIYDVISQIDTVDPEVVIVDSIQTMYDESVSSTPSSLSQVKECTMALINKAKSTGIAILIVGHVNKEGSIAGPKVIEHMVDAVLHFEGERSQQNRIVRAEKNRYGSTNEIGVFEMTDEGLKEITNPTEMLLLGRPVGVPGNCTVCIVEGSRPLLAEVQALVTKTVFPTPKRTSSGIDYNRLNLLLAVMEKRAGYYMQNLDIYVNVVGGLELDETSIPPFSVEGTEAASIEFIILENLL
jgi:DNA repair protein RadA/Sms